MSHGKMHYFGPVSTVTAHFESLGHQIPIHVNPAEYLLELTNTDFLSNREAAMQRLEQMQLAWAESHRARELAASVVAVEERGCGVVDLRMSEKPSLLSVVLTLLHRSFVKSYRDVVAYGIRLAMYTGENLYWSLFSFGVLINRDHRACYHDRHRLAQTAFVPGVHNSVHQRHLLVWLPDEFLLEQVIANNFTAVAPS